MSEVRAVSDKTRKEKLKMAGSTGALEIQMTGANASWGVQQRVRNGIKTNNITGVVTSWNDNKEYVKAPCLNEVGSRIGEMVYDFHKSGEAVIQVGSQVSVPAFNTIISINDGLQTVEFRVISGRITESNQDYRRMALQIEAWGYKFTPQLADSNFNNVFR